MCVPNRLDPDQTRHSDHGPLTKLFATTKLVPSRQRVVLHVFTGIYFKLISEYYCFKMVLIGVLISGECEMHTSLIGMSIYKLEQ